MATPARKRKSAPARPRPRAKGPPKPKASQPRRIRSQPKASPPAAPPPAPVRPDLSWMYYTAEEKAALERPATPAPAPAAAPSAPPSPPPPTVQIKGPRLENVPIFSGRGVVGMLLLLVMFGPLVLLVVLGFVAMFQGAEPVPGNAASTAFQLIVILIAFVMLPVAYIRSVRPREDLDEHLRLRDKQGALRFLLGLGIGLGMVIALGLLLYGYTLATGQELEEESPVVRDTGQMLLDHPYFVLLIPLVAGFGEEIFFRGFLQRRIGLLPAALAFGIVHIGYGTWLQLIAPFFAGLVFGYTVKRSGSLWIAIGAHVGFNLVQLGLAYVAAQNPELAALVAFT